MLLLYIWANFRCFGSYGCNDTVHIIICKIAKIPRNVTAFSQRLGQPIWWTERCRLRIREKTSRLQEVYTTWKRWKVAWDSEPPILISITRIIGDLTYHEPSSYCQLTDSSWHWRSGGSGISGGPWRVASQDFFGIINADCSKSTKSSALTTTLLGSSFLSRQIIRQQRASQLKIDSWGR